MVIHVNPSFLDNSTDGTSWANTLSTLLGSRRKKGIQSLRERTPAFSSRQADFHDIQQLSRIDFIEWRNWSLNQQPRFIVLYVTSHSHMFLLQNSLITQEIKNETSFGILAFDNSPTFFQRPSHTFSCLSIKFPCFGVGTSTCVFELQAD